MKVWKGKGHVNLWMSPAGSIVIDFIKRTYQSPTWTPSSHPQPFSTINKKWVGGLSMKLYSLGLESTARLSAIQVPLSFEIYCCRCPDGDPVPMCGAYVSPFLHAIFYWNICKLLGDPSIRPLHAVLLVVVAVVVVLTTTLTPGQDNGQFAPQNQVFKMWTPCGSSWADLSTHICTT